MRVFVTYLFAFFLSAGGTISKGIGQEDTKHRVTINHPAFGKDDPTTFYLWELKGENNKLEGYFLDAKSVICFDHRCKVVPVRLFWDAVGMYQKYELTDGTILEKKEGEPFLPADYDRLHEILQDKSSPYKDFSYYEITQERVQGEGEVDAVSGPSPVIVDETKTVAGAAWTCFTLWHWANGEIVQEIQRISGEASSWSDLIRHIGSGNYEQYVFSLNELIKRKNHNPLVVKAVIDQAIKARNDSRFLHYSLNYLEMAQAEIYYQSMQKLLKTSATGRRIVVLNSISGYKIAPPEEYFEQFWDKIIASNNYQEINLYLTVLEEKGSSTQSLIQKLIPLLQEDYSIINRRIYWYLSEQKLSQDQKQIVKSYHDRYSDFL